MVRFRVYFIFWCLRVYRCFWAVGLGPLGVMDFGPLRVSLGLASSYPLNWFSGGGFAGRPLIINLCFSKDNKTSFADQK